MAVALQWQVAHSGPDKIVATTERTFNDCVMIAACTCRRGDVEDSRAAAKLSRAVVDAYTAASTRIAPDKSPKSTAELLSDAITRGLRRVARDSRAASTTSNVIAIAVRSKHLFVARWGCGEAFLLRAGVLEHLTSGDAFGDPFEFINSITAGIEPELGELELQSEDRVLVCTGTVAEVLEPAQLQHTLRAQPSARRTAHALLLAAQSAHNAESHGLAILDIVSGKVGIYPAKYAPTSHIRSAGGMPAMLRRTLPFAALATAALIGATIIALPAGATSQTQPANVSIAASIGHHAPVAARTAVPFALASAIPSVHVTRLIADQPAAPRAMLAEPAVAPQPNIQPASTHSSAYAIEAAPRATLISQSHGQAVSASESASEIETEATQVEATQSATATPRPIPTLRLSIEPRTATVTIGEPLTLRAIVRDASGARVESSDVRWLPADLVTGTDARTATFNTASAGTFTVVAYFGDVRASAKIFVLVPLQATPLAANAVPTVTQAEFTAAPAAIITLPPEASTEPPTPTSQPQPPVSSDSAPATPSPAATPSQESQ